MSPEETGKTGSPTGRMSQLKQDNRFLRQQLAHQGAELDQLRQALQLCEELKLQSQRNEAERAQLLAQEHELNELKSNFITLASHEFRTPIGTILMSASLISRYNGAQEGEKRERHVQRIKSSVHELTTLLNEFLSLSQMEHQAPPNRPQPLALPSFCGQIVEEMREVLKPGQTIRYQHTAGDPSLVMDEMMLKNILINLLGNASKYSAGGKQIELTTAIRDGQLQIEVHDQGIGIPDVDKDKLFINFFRARNAIHIQGTGLGLYLVKRYVDLLGGTVTFTSELNVDTVFTVRLPFIPLPA